MENYTEHTDNLAEQEAKYIISGYYDYKMRGLAESETASDLDMLKDIAHEYASKGYILKLKNIKTGNCITISPDDYFDNFNGESPIPEF